MSLSGTNRIKDLLSSREKTSSIITSVPDGVKKQVLDLTLKYDESNICEIDSSPNKRVLEEGFISIDASYSKDLDDAIKAERRKDWWYTLWVSIADVAEIIKSFSDADIFALLKTTSFYFDTHAIGMFSKEISNFLTSLNHDTKKLTLTVQIDLDDQANILNSKVYESITHNEHRFDYEEYNNQFKNPESKYYDKLHLYDEISQKLRNKRRISWSILNFDESDRRTYIWKKRKNEDGPYSQTIEEFMILANKTIAEMSFPGMIYRNHMSDYKDKKFTWTQFEKAYYSLKMIYHYWLALKHYTHFTSPIRRYTDLMVHRAIKSFLRWEPLDYSLEELKTIYEHINNTRLKVDKAEKEISTNNTDKNRKRFIFRAEKGNISKEELQYLWEDDFKRVIFSYISAYRNSQKVPWVILSELKERASLALIDSETLILVLFSGNKDLSSIWYGNLDKIDKYPESYIVRYLREHSPINNNLSNIRIVENTFRKDWIYERNIKLFVNWSEIINFDWIYEENYIWKKDLRSKLIDYLLDKNINLSKSIINSKKLTIESIVEKRYPKNNLSKISMYNFEKIIEYHIENDVDFDNNFKNEIKTRIASESENNLILSDKSLSFLLFSKKSIFKKDIIKKLENMRKTKFFISFLKSRKDIEMIEYIDINLERYEIIMNHNWEKIIDETMIVDSKSWKDYDEQKSDLRLAILRKLVSKNISLFD